MARDKFIWCRNCNAIHHISPFDKAPTYTVLENEFQARPADDWRSFMNAHADHWLEPLEAMGAKQFPNGSFFDPMNVAYIEVSNGNERLLLRQIRKSIDDQLSFELVSGRLVHRSVSLEIQANEIKHEMKYHCTWTPGVALDDYKIDRFIELFRAVIQEFDPKEIKLGGYSGTDDEMTYGLLPAEAVEKLMTRCAAAFSADELADLRKFVDAHIDPYDVMAPVMRRRVEFVPTE